MHIVIIVILILSFLLFYYNRFTAKENYRKNNHKKYVRYQKTRYGEKKDRRL